MGINLYYPTPPFIQFPKPAAYAVTVELWEGPPIPAGEEELVQPMPNGKRKLPRFFSRTTGREIPVRENSQGELEYVPTPSVSLLQEEQTTSTKTELFINIGYAYTCRRWKSDTVWEQCFPQLRALTNTAGLLEVGTSVQVGSIDCSVQNCNPSPNPPSVDAASMAMSEHAITASEADTGETCHTTCLWNLPYG